MAESVATTVCHADSLPARRVMPSVVRRRGPSREPRRSRQDQNSSTSRTCHRRCLQTSISPVLCLDARRAGPSEQMVDHGPRRQAITTAASGAAGRELLATLRAAGRPKGATQASASSVASDASSEGSSLCQSGSTRAMRAAARRTGVARVGKREGPSSMTHPGPQRALWASPRPQQRGLSVQTESTRSPARRARHPTAKRRARGSGLCSLRRDAELTGLWRDPALQRRPRADALLVRLTHVGSGLRPQIPRSRCGRCVALAGRRAQRRGRACPEEGGRARAERPLHCRGCAAQSLGAA